jgi:hypothetical protein
MTLLTGEHKEGTRLRHAGDLLHRITQIGGGGDAECDGPAFGFSGRVAGIAIAASRERSHRDHPDGRYGSP